MNRRSIFILSAISALGLALLPSGIVAQQGSLQKQLVGTWMLVSYDATAADGTRQELKLMTINVLPTGAKIEQVYRRAK
jgi:hypothetical protein